MSSNFRVFLSKRMKSSNDNPMTVLNWNRANKLIACGYHNGQVNLYIVVPSRDQPGQMSVENVQCIDYHKKSITVVSWSENGKYLATGDSSGKIAFWALKNKVWKHTLTNSTVSSNVTSIRWSRSCESAAITYSDSTCACVSNSGDLVWTTSMRQSVDFVEWTAHGDNLLCGTIYGEVMIVDNRGVESGAVQLPCLSDATTDPKLVALEWKRRANYGLMIAYQGGQIQLMRNESDTQPIVITIELELTTATWFKSGSAFAVAGVKSTGHNVIVFLTSKGDTIRELEVQGSRINSLSLDSIDTQIAMAIETQFCLAQIIPQFNWAYTKHTLLYSYNNSDGNESTLIYYNHKTEEKRVRTLSNVICVSGNSGNFVIATKSGAEETLISITDTIGVTIATSVISFIPSWVSINQKTIAAADPHHISVWKYEEEDTPQMINIDENISTILLRESSLILSMGSHIVTLEVPSLAEVNKFGIGFACESIVSSSDGNTLALFDASGTLQFFSIKDGRVVGPARREIWNMAWADDNPHQFAAIERQKLFVFNDLEPEEPIPSLAHIARFSNLEILCIDLIKLMQDPLNPGRRLIKRYPTKTLKELRILLATRPQTAIEDIMEFCKKQGYKKLWNELAQAAMLEMNFTLAEKCFLETTNYRGLQFIKRVRAVKDANLQRAQVFSYLGKFDEAQSIYNSMDRLDLAVEMRASVGDFENVIDILGPNQVGNDETVAEAYNNVGDSYMEQSDWITAAENYEASGDYEKLMKCYYMADDFSNLQRLLNKLPTNSPLMLELGRMFVSMGAVKEAANAFMAAGDLGAAVDACARLNNWKMALELTGKGKVAEIKARMNRYANQLIENGQKASAIDFYARSGLGVEAAKILLREGDELLKIGDDFVSSKMCYVFAALQLEKHISGAFDGSTTAADRLDGLMKDDEATTSGLYSEVWRKAEAVHYYLLAHRMMYRHKWIDALICACHVFEEYSDIIGEDKAAALMAITGMKTRHFGQCSRAMTTLEHYDDFPKERKEKFEDLSIDIFTKNRPIDPNMVGAVACTKCGNMVSMLQGSCAECGNKMRLCTATGRLILDSSYWQCKCCRHYVLIDIAEDLIVCPMCHHPITD